MAIALARDLPVARTARAPTRARVAELCQVLSDATRLAILELLRDGERCVCELTAALDAAQPRLSFHLRVLKDAGLVSDRREGRWAYYTLTPGGAEDVHAFVAGLEQRRRLGRRAALCCG
jgi:ArsR family transcriptional regulator, arsenate/arsenite/antimonite-responsive transcriptional repressor